MNTMQEVKRIETFSTIYYPVFCLFRRISFVPILSLIQYKSARPLKMNQNSVHEMLKKKKTMLYDLTYRHTHSFALCEFISSKVSFLLPYGKINSRCNSKYKCNVAIKLRITNAYATISVQTRPEI